MYNYPHKLHRSVYLRTLFNTAHCWMTHESASYNDIECSSGNNRNRRRQERMRNDKYSPAKYLSINQTRKNVEHRAWFRHTTFGHRDSSPLHH